MDVKIEQSWKTRLQNEFEKEYFINLTNFVKKEFNLYTVYPPGRLIFNAFDKCPFENVRVVILGQDPYHGPGQAHGLCFSVKNGVAFPPSLINIYKEINNDLDTSLPDSGNLERWAEQGVLLLNATLTVRAGQAGSHQNKGWELFTDEIVQLVAKEKNNVVFILWGSYAQRKGETIDRTKHLVLESPHPSPLSASRGFFGNKHFSKANVYLEEHGMKPVEW